MCELCNAGVENERADQYVDNLDVADWLTLCDGHALALVDAAREAWARRRPQ